MRRSRLGTTLAIGLALPLSLAACGSSDNASGSTPMASASSTTAMSSPSTTSMSSSTAASSTSSSSTADAMADTPFGPACAAVPADGMGSFAGMAGDPVATAASHNPALKKLVAAVTEAGLVDTLNSAKDITVFAPTDDAFAALPTATMNAAMKDPKGLLTKVLTNHVVEGRLTPADVVGEHKTLAGTMVTVTGSGTNLMVGKAKVVCGNVQTANATVYIIDGVLLP